MKMSKKHLSESEKITTEFLEKQGLLFPLEETDERVESPYGKALSETVYSVITFEEGNLCTLCVDDKPVFSKFYSRERKNGETKETNRK